MNFAGRHILGVSQFSRTDIEQIMTVADTMLPYVYRQKRTRVLEGAVLANLFFEPSTRTRVSFGTAFNLLGGSVRETTGLSSSALSKGESLWDTARVISGYADVIAMRHPEAGSVEDFAQGSEVPVLNGGDGANEHPTQALLDIYTIKDELARSGRDIDGMHIALMGDLKHGRTVHSLCRLLALYRNLKITLISPAGLGLPDSILTPLVDRGHRISQAHTLGDLKDTDVVYQTRIQQERFTCIDQANRFRGQLRLDASSFTRHFGPQTIIMHPLPRDARAEANELNTDLDSHPNLAIFRQAQNGVAVRMALFALTLNVHERVTDYEHPVIWHTAKTYPTTT